MASEAATTRPMTIIVSADSAELGYADARYMAAASECRAGADRPRVRVAEPVTDRDDGFDVPYLFDHVMSDPGGLGHALDGDDAFLDGDRELARVTEQHAEDDVVDDLAPDVAVGTVVHAQHVSPGDDPDQPAVVVHYREPLHLAGVHQPRRVRDEFVWPDGHRRLGHQVGRGGRGGLGLLPVVQHAANPARGAELQRLLGQQVSLGHHADDLVVLIKHGERAYPVLPQPRCHLFEWRVLPDGDHVRRHDVLHGGVHRNRPFLAHRYWTKSTPRRGFRPPSNDPREGDQSPNPDIWPRPALHGRGRAPGATLRTFRTRISGISGIKMVVRYVKWTLGACVTADVTRWEAGRQA